MPSWIGKRRGKIVALARVDEMKDILDSIRRTQDFEGILVLSKKGELIYQEFLSSPPPVINDRDLRLHLIAPLNRTQEAELVFSRKRLYIRKTDKGYLFIVMGLFAPISKIRIYCDIIVRSLNQEKRAKGLAALFKGEK
ncbi:MAG: hypothetical protein JRJ03_10420 [Deltaproteobacteria bacterium]|nr:hypothetical protein [Deltaproteobacteria bacterium]